MTKKPIILGIETSCDETAVSIIQENENNKPSILSNIISSQVDVHKEFGGVVPELAARSHIEKIDLIAKKAIEESKIKIIPSRETLKQFVRLSPRASIVMRWLRRLRPWKNKHQRYACGK